MSSRWLVHLNVHNHHALMMSCLMPIRGCGDNVMKTLHLNKCNRVTMLMAALMMMAPQIMTVTVIVAERNWRYP